MLTLSQKILEFLIYIEKSIRIWKYETPTSFLLYKN